MTFSNDRASLVQGSKPVAESPEMKAGNARIQEIKASISGAKQLYLVVSDLGDNTCDWANWIEPTLTLKGGKTVDLTELKWRSSAGGYNRALWRKENSFQCLTKNPLLPG